MFTNDDNPVAKDDKERSNAVQRAKDLAEINEEIKESFEHAGGETFTYIPCLNDDDAHIAALSEIIAENLGGWVV